MLTLCREYGLVAKYLLSFYNENDICKLRVVDDLAHVLNQAVYSLIVDLILLQLADVKDADVIEPLAAIEATEDKELLCPNHTSSMALTTSRSLLAFYRVTPAHGVCIQDIQIVGRDDFLEGAPSAIVATKEVHLVSYQVCCVAS